MQIIAFTDGRPGHEKQTRGIIEGLRRRLPVEVQTVSVSRPSLLARVKKSLQLLLPITVAKASETRENRSVDLIIGTGSVTHLDMLLAKKRTGARAIVSMAPDWYLRRFFDLCLVPEHDNCAPATNVFRTMGAPNLSVADTSEKSARGLILLGGIDERSHSWNDEDILAMVGEIVRRESDRKWTISSSPRTPAKTVAYMRELCTREANADFFAFADTADGWVEDQYAQSEIVWVSADSISMIFEALGARCKVGILPLRWRRTTSKFAKNENILMSRRLVVAYREWLKGGVDWSGNNPGEFNEAQRCADYIVERWWSINSR